MAGPNKVFQLGVDVKNIKSGVQEIVTLFKQLQAVFSQPIVIKVDAAQLKQLTTGLSGIAKQVKQSSEDSTKSITNAINALKAGLVSVQPAAAAAGQAVNNALTQGAQGGAAAVAAAAQKATAALSGMSDRQARDFEAYVQKIQTRINALGPGIREAAINTLGTFPTASGFKGSTVGNPPEPGIDVFGGPKSDKALINQSLLAVDAKSGKAFIDPVVKDKIETALRAYEGGIREEIAALQGLVKQTISSAARESQFQAAMETASGRFNSLLSKASTLGNEKGLEVIDKLSASGINKESDLTRVNQSGKLVPDQTAIQKANEIVSQATKEYADANKAAAKQLADTITTEKSQSDANKLKAKEEEIFAETLRKSTNEFASMQSRIAKLPDDLAAEARSSIKALGVNVPSSFVSKTTSGFGVNKSLVDKADAALVRSEEALAARTSADKQTVAELEKNLRALNQYQAAVERATQQWNEITAKISKLPAELQDIARQRLAQAGLTGPESLLKPTGVTGPTLGTGGVRIGGGELAPQLGSNLANLNSAKDILGGLAGGNKALAESSGLLDTITKRHQAVGISIADSVINLGKWLVFYRLVRDTMREIESLFSSFISSGLQITKQQEEQQRSLAGILATNFDVRDSQGQLLTGAAKYVAVQQEASRQTKLLSESTKGISASVQDLHDIYVQIAEPVTRVGGGTQKILEVTRLTAVAAQALGISYKEAGDEVAHLLQGQGENNKLAELLKLSPADVKILADTPQLLDKITTGLKTLDVTADETFGGIITKFQQAVGEVSANIESPIIDVFKQFVQYLTTLQNNTAFKDFMADIKTAMQGAAEELRSFGAELKSQFSGSTAQIAIGIGDIASGVVKVAEAIAIAGLKITQFVANNQTLIKTAGGLVIFLSVVNYIDRFGSGVLRAANALGLLQPLLTALQPLADGAARGVAGLINYMTGATIASGAFSAAISALSAVLLSFGAAALVGVGVYITENIIAKWAAAKDAADQYAESQRLIAIGKPDQAFLAIQPQLDRKIPVEKRVGEFEPGKSGNSPAGQVATQTIEADNQFKRYGNTIDDVVKNVQDLRTQLSDLNKEITESSSLSDKDRAAKQKQAGALSLQIGNMQDEMSARIAQFTRWRDVLQGVSEDAQALDKNTTKAINDAGGIDAVNKKVAAAQSAIDKAPREAKPIEAERTVQNLGPLRDRYLVLQQINDALKIAGQRTQDLALAQKTLEQGSNTFKPAARPPRLPVVAPVAEKVDFVSNQPTIAAFADDFSKSIETLKKKRDDDLLSEEDYYQKFTELETARYKTTKDLLAQDSEAFAKYVEDKKASNDKEHQQREAIIPLAQRFPGSPDQVKEDQIVANEEEALRKRVLDYLLAHNKALETEDARHNAVSEQAADDDRKIITNRGDADVKAHALVQGEIAKIYGRTSDQIGEAIDARAQQIEHDLRHALSLGEEGRVEAQRLADELRAHRADAVQLGADKATQSAAASIVDNLRKQQQLLNQELSAGVVSVNAYVNKVTQLRQQESDAINAQIRAAQSERAILQQDQSVNPTIEGAANIERLTAQIEELQQQFVLVNSAAIQFQNTLKAFEGLTGALDGVFQILAKISDKFSGLSTVSNVFDDVKKSIASFTQVLPQTLNFLGQIKDTINQLSKAKSIGGLGGIFTALGGGKPAASTAAMTAQAGGEADTSIAGSATAAGGTGLASAIGAISIVGAGLGVAIGVFSAMFQAAVERAKKRIDDGFTKITEAINDGRVQLGAGLTELVEYRKQVVAQESDSKAGRKALKEELPKIDSEMKQILATLQQRIKSFEDEVTSMSFGPQGDPFADFARQLMEMQTKTSEYLDAVKNANLGNAQAYVDALNLVKKYYQDALAEEKAKLKSELSDAESEAIQSAQTVVDLLDQQVALHQQISDNVYSQQKLQEQMADEATQEVDDRAQIEQDRLDNVKKIRDLEKEISDTIRKAAEDEYKIRTQGVLEAQQTIAQQKASQISQVRSDAAQKLSDLNDQLASLGDPQVKYQKDLDKLLKKEKDQTEELRRQQELLQNQAAQLQQQLQLNDIKLGYAEQIYGIEGAMFGLSLDRFDLERRRGDLEVIQAQKKVEEWTKVQSLINSIIDSADGLMFNPPPGFPQIKVQIGDITIDNSDHSQTNNPPAPAPAPQPGRQGPPPNPSVPDGPDWTPPYPGWGPGDAPRDDYYPGFGI